MTAIPVVGTTKIIKESQPTIQANSYTDHDIIVDWDNLYGGPNEDLFRNIKQTTDIGYIAVGVWNSTSHWLAKFNETGHMQWDTTALPNASLWPRCYIVEQTNDGGYITAGCHEDNQGFGYNRCIWKIDATGTTEWCKTYDDPLHGYHMCIQQTIDGGYIVAGEVDVAPGDWDVLLMKIDSLGNIEWQQIHKYGTYGDNAYAVRQTTDGGYILCGRFETSPSEADILVIKTDASGNIVWDETYGGSKWEWTQCNDILIDSDGYYYFLGETDSYGAGSRDIWFFKTDSTGNMLWNTTFGGAKYDMGGGMDFTTDEGIIICGTLGNNEFNPPKGQGIVIKTDLDGVLEWQHICGYDEGDQLQGVCSTNDGGYIVAGNSDETSTSGAGLYDGWLYKMQPFTNNAPEADRPTGDKKGEVGIEYIFTATASDPDGDMIEYYRWDWDDGNISDWLDTDEASHIYLYEDVFKIRVQVKDSYGMISEWSEPHSFSTPYSISLATTFNLQELLIQRFPIFFKIVKNIFRK
jgi:hypothetical protein